MEQDGVIIATTDSADEPIRHMFLDVSQIHYVKFGRQITDPVSTELNQTFSITLLQESESQFRIMAYSPAEDWVPQTEYMNLTVMNKVQGLEVTDFNLMTETVISSLKDFELISIYNNVTLSCSHSHRTPRARPSTSGCPSR